MTNEDRDLGRWERPLKSAPERYAAWASTLVKDHGVFRLIYRNRHQVSEELWRSSQPIPSDIRWARRKGVRTIISLRHSSNFGAWPLMKETCERKGLALVNLPLFSREPPTHQAVRYAKHVFDTIEYPALLHCKSGADRAGMGSALYVLLRQGGTADEAIRQLNWRFGHFSFAKTGILDAFLRRYKEDGEAKGISFVDWIETGYDRAALFEEFRSNYWADVLTDKLLRRE
ncbi:fused DSP-PTPase phosphatase/NAD kinase-like protein [Amorphus orientalis]|uniref:Protein tyrosine phosphatase (PTP) superfamily phosphohydrolase (DUF442 family) n=1 Tax=Amorphus orientalis TaxID=649198 RepID=A0AAE4ATF0_9HYPH|nr:sulfur transferase domain-containing protein [Amorphus orientalis]MDQ0316213.1 protein tyrosine phosphatase (PTP) superfamily phosphohydrolase (DUF442 family) [Amorphus orientalis]